MQRHDYDTAPLRGKLYVYTEGGGISTVDVLVLSAKEGKHKRIRVIADTISDVRVVRQRRPKPPEDPSS